MAEQIVLGSVVVLRSGGPAMTVGSFERDMAACHWFNDEGQPQSSFFPKVVLMTYDPVEED